MKQKAATSDFRNSLAAVLVLLVLFSAVIYYVVGMTNRHDGFTALYFEPESLKSGIPLVVIENHEAGRQDYRLFANTSSMAFSDNFSLASGESLSINPLNGTAWASELTVKLFSENSTPLSIYSLPPGLRRN